MAERRAIKSKIWEDEFFGNLSDLAMLVWIGLFSRMADDQGRLIDNPSLISAQIFPYKGVQASAIEGCLCEFSDRIIRYEAGGRRYIQIVKWWENQPQQYATPSNYPAPDGWEDHYRTNYKGKYIVYNWPCKDSPPNNEIGILLHDKLKSLARVSSWMDLLGTLNPTPTPTPTPNQGGNKGNGSNPPSQTPEEKIYCAVTNHPTIPSGSLYEIINAIQKIMAAKGFDNNQMIEYLRPFWNEAKKRYTKSVGVFWLVDWAVIGNIPDPIKVNGNGHNNGFIPRKVIKRDANGNEMEFLE